jgi:type I restriction enzyme R subunit
VEKFAKAEAWQALGRMTNEVDQRCGRPADELVDDDEEAKRFDLLVLRTQLAILQALPDFAGLRQKIQSIASALEEQEAIPAIKAQMVLIQAVAGDEWWEDVTVPMLETARKRLRALVKLIEKGEKKVVYTDFVDELGDETASTCRR